MSLRIYGCGGIAVVALEILQESNVLVDGCFDEDSTVKEFCKLSVELPTTDELSRCQAIVCIGDNVQRKKITLSLSVYPKYIAHRTACISPSASVGVGSMLFHKSIVQARTRIGEGVILNTGASIDHDCEIGDYSHIAPNTTLCGHVKVGQGANIGAGSVVIPGISIGEWSTIGAGTVVIKDVPPNSLVVGNPGRIVR